MTPLSTRSPRWPLGLALGVLGLLALGMVAAQTRAGETTLYVRPDGNGSAFTRERPGSLAGVQARVRELRASASGPVTVYLGGGTYELAAPLTFTAPDGGTAGRPVTYRAVEGERPVLSGGTRVNTPWTVHDAGKGILRTTLPRNLDFRQLYVNGVRGVRARSENDPKGFKKTIGGYVLDPASPYGGLPGWRRPGDLELVGFNEWKSFRCGLDRVEPQTRVLGAPANRPAYPVASVRASDFQKDPANPPQGAIDGNPATRWSAEGQQWIEFDLGAAQPVGAVTTAWLNGDQRGTRFALAVSTDGASWATVYDGASSAVSADPELFAFAARPARYVRILARGNSTNAWNSLVEARVYGPATGAESGTREVQVLLARAEEPCWTNTQRHAAWPMNAVKWVENAYELLDQPGEWYYDRASGDLYVIPRPGEDLARAEVVYPRLDMLVEGRGTLDAPVAHLRFEGLTFAYAGWRRPSSPEGYPVVQAGFMYHGEEGGRQLDGLLKTPSAVSFQAAHDVVFGRNTFTHLGAGGLGFGAGSQRNLAVGNRFTDISSHAVMVGDISEHRPGDPRAVVKDNTVRSNLIMDIGVEFPDAVAVFVGYTDHTVVTHNDISRLPYTAVSVGWGWNGVNNAPGSQFTTPSVMRANEVSHNRISDYMRVLRDGGAVYTLGWQPGSLIVGNHVSTPDTAVDGGYSGLYFDEGSGYFTARDNVFELPQKMGRGWLNLSFKNDVKDIVVENSYTTTPAIGTEGRDAGLTLKGTVTGPRGGWPAAARAIIERAGLEAAYADLRGEGAR